MYARDATEADRKQFTADKEGRLVYAGTVSTTPMANSFKLFTVTFGDRPPIDLHVIPTGSNSLGADVPVPGDADDAQSEAPSFAVPKVYQTSNGPTAWSGLGQPPHKQAR